MSHCKPYPAYRDSGVEWIGQVPAHWRVTPLKVIADTVNGATPESGKPEYWDGDIAWYTPTDIDNEVASELGAPRRYITQAGYESCAVKLSPPGSVVLSTRAPIGSIGTTTIPSTINQGCRTLIPAQDVPTSYLASTLVAAREELRLRGNGTTFQELSTEALKSLRVPMPPRSECVSIAIGLDRETARIDALITKKTRFIELLKEKRQALITHAVTKGLDPNVKMKDSGVEWLGEVPAHWQIKPLWSVFKPIKRTGFVNEQLLSVYRDYGVIPKSSRDDNRNRASDDLSPYQLVEPDNLVTNKMKTWQGSIAVSEHRGIVSPAYFVYEAIEPLFGRFIHHLMRSSPYITGYMSISKGIRVGQWDLDQEHFRVFPILFPSLIEQKAIVKTLDSETARIDLVITKTQRSIDLLKERRAAFITAAVTGQIDLRESA